MNRILVAATVLNGFRSMVELLLSCAWLVAVAWLILRALGQRGLLRKLAARGPAALEQWPRVAVIVPARDEEANIGPCLARLKEQTYSPERLSLIVVDDHSSDATQSHAKDLLGDQPQARCLACPPLPPGWVGKSHACWFGASVAADSDWLCFVDADVRLTPDALASAVLAAMEDKIDLLSLAPRQELGSFAERLMIPCGLYILAFSRDLHKEEERQAERVTGQFLLVRRASYDSVGGHAAVAREICEDLALARRIRQSGGCVLLCDGGNVVSTRMYDGWPSLWMGLVKNLVETLGGPRSTLTIAAVAVSLAWASWLVPLLDALHCAEDRPLACVATLPALAATAAAIGLHVSGALHFGIPPWYGLLFPVGYTAGAAMAVDSLRRRRRGRVPWKGRTYP